MDNRKKKLLQTPSKRIYLEAVCKGQQSLGQRFSDLFLHEQLAEKYEQMIEKELSKGHRNRFYKGDRTYFYLIAILCIALLSCYFSTKFTLLISVILSTVIVGLIEYFIFCDFLIPIGKMYIDSYRPIIRVRFENSREVKKVIIGRDINRDLIMVDMDAKNTSKLINSLDNIQIYFCDKSGLGIALSAYIRKQSNDIIYIQEKMYNRLEKDYVNLVLYRKRR